MTQFWFFQANPDQFDIDKALDALTQIWWRVPQHTYEIHSGNVVAIWRSGKEAGIVAIGRVVTEPQVHPIDPAELPFALSQDEKNDSATRVLVQLRKAPFVQKESIRSTPEFRDHQIIRAPMGTVFPISDKEWLGVRDLLPPPPDKVEERRSSLPPAFAWAQRAKGVLPMPGGYSGYLDSLRHVCSIVVEERPTPLELVPRLVSVLGVRETAARLRESFLRKSGIIELQDGLCKLSSWTDAWRSTGDDQIVIALLHSRCQLIGELLESAVDPKTSEELLAVANERFGMGWDTQTQIANRRGWLQSAGMLAPNPDGRIQTTDLGKDLMSHLSLFAPNPALTGSQAVPETVVASESRLIPPELKAAVDLLVDTIKASSTQNTEPDRFEHAVRDAFDFLGFHAEWLGGPGRTDVLLEALLGKNDSYTAIVDCKTSGSGSVNDSQVDWVTLSEHKKKHAAQYVCVVCPNPTGNRLFDRAKEQLVTIISADQLAGLCRQHSKSPRGLDIYRNLFQTAGAVETQVVDESAEDGERIAKLATSIIDTIRLRSMELGRLTARDLYVLLSETSAAEGAIVEDIQGLLDSLSSSLLGFLEGSPEDGYRVTSAATVFQQRLEVLSNLLGLEIDATKDI